MSEAEAQERAAGGVLHKFPHPSLDIERFQRWVENIGGPITELDNIFIFNNRRVCRRHFETVFHYPKNRLCKLAVPTLFTQGVQSEQEMPVRTLIIEQPIQTTLLDITHHSQIGVRMKMNIADGKENIPINISCAERTIPMMDIASCSKNTAASEEIEPMDIVIKEHLRPIDIPKPVPKKQDVRMKMNIADGKENIPINISCPERTIPMMDIASCSKNIAASEEIEPMDIVIKEHLRPMDIPKPVPKKQEYKTSNNRKEIELRKTVLKLKADLRRTKALKISYKRRLSMAMKAVNKRAFEILTQKMTKATKTFINIQVTQLGKKKKGRRFTLNEKILALSLYKASPKAYRLLSELYILPQRKTLQGVLRKLNLQPGINNTLIKQLKKKVAKLPINHRYCTIIFDEMAVAPSLTYDRKNDKITGFVDDGEKREAKIADHVLVFMVRGVVKKYKQPIAYSFCAGTTKTHDLKKMIKNVIETVESANLKVVATVCDQGATNVAAINSLLSETKEKYTRKGVEWRGGFFELNDKKIFPIYDSPHLIKGVRNNLLTKNLKYKLNGKDCTAKWEHVVQLYNRAPGYKGVRLVPKLTAHHVFPKLIPKMRVKHCTQVFSRSVGVALGFMADEGKLPPESKETADVLMLFDELFDSVNGSFSKVQNGKIYRTALTPSSVHHKLWRDSLPILKSMQFIGNDNKSAIVPSLSSWVKTIEGFQAISVHMRKLGVNSLLLRHFNQDPVENFFGAIRAQGCSNIMPTAASFQAAYKTLLVNNMVSAHSVGANCEKDKDKCLQSLKYLFKAEETTEEAYQEIEVEEKHLFMQPIDTNNLIRSDSHVDRERCAAIGYCSGWLIKTAKKNIYKSCATCKNDLESEEHEDFHAFIKVKEYNEKGWLCYPKREIFDNFTQIENVTNEILKNSSVKHTMFEYLQTIVSIHIQWDFITCKIHKDRLVHYLIKKNIFFCIDNWCREINNILIGKAPLWDQNDPIKVQAYEHHQKYKLRKRVRQTGIELNV